MTGSIDTEEVVKKFKPLGHAIQGFVAGLVNFHWYTWKREVKQYPPATDRLPPVWIDTEDVVHSVLTKNSDLYFAAERVDDVYRDFMDYHVGYMLAGIFKDIVWMAIVVCLIAKGSW